MQIDWWTLGLQTANVLVLVWILGRFLFRPVAGMIEQRRVLASKALDDARAAQAAAEAARVEAEHTTADLARSRADALKKAAQEAEAERQGIIAAARAEAERLREAAKADIARARADEAAAAQGRASALALDIADKLLSRLPEQARIDGFIPGLAQGLAALPDEIRASLGADGHPVRLKAARALSDAEVNACRDQLSKALGRPIEIACETDPALIAGLELDMPHAAVRNSLRADLDRVAGALAKGSKAGAPSSNGSATP
ncbi:F0F1 ATP synthase subunit delta [Ancylobacter mangrovi]|uniref:F0F1 ATP synthase subunit delta n=1 Tax=Ancylobacter mangrovi TaxID=2972472 RepID=UPI0021639384|nr:F0F1 ATP synthase subunit delta [Ancylobacter mangrovi]MCS0503468.1 F0F1 ATP synthase subunit delta [Ancylobacter mangrovi]